jgi:hypothetical protein
MEHRASTIELRGFTLIARPFGEIIKSLLAGYFQSDGFKCCVHKSTNKNSNRFSVE